MMLIMSHCDAWLIHSSDDLQFACGLNEFVEIVQKPQLIPIPGTPGHCRQLSNWRDHWIPVMRPAHIQKAQIGDPEHLNIGVLCYQTSAGQALEYGAVVLHQQPEKIQVNDLQACELSSNQHCYQAISLACFEHRGIATPVFDLARLFTLPPSTYIHD